MEPLPAVAVPSRLRAAPDPVTIGLSMVNWLVLMLLMSGFLLATTASEPAVPAGKSSGISGAAQR